MINLIEIFREEVETNLKEATRLALAFEQSPPGRTDTEDMMRVFHTLKGAARAIQFDQERDVAHLLEDIFHDLLDGKSEFRPQVVDLSLAAVDLIRDSLVARINGGDLPPMDPFATRIKAYRSGGDAAPTVAVAADTAEAPPPAPNPPRTRVNLDPGLGLDLMAIFQAEVTAQSNDARALLADFDPSRASEREMEDLRRVFHTLKGAARAIGCDPIRELAGSVEDLMRGLKDGTTAATPDLRQVAECALRWIEGLMPALIAGDPAPPVAPIMAQLDAYRESGITSPCNPPSNSAAAPTTDAARPAEMQTDDRPGLTPHTEPESGPDSEIVSAPESAPAAPTHPGNAQSAGTKGGRLGYEQLDRLHRLSGELTVAVSSLAGQRLQMRGLGRELNRSGQQLNRLMAGILTDDLEPEDLHDALRQIVQRLDETTGRLDGLTDTHDRIHGRFHHLADAVADEVTQARLVPLTDLFDDYPRMARDLAHELGKQVELRIEGADNRIDRAVLEHLRNPLLHLLRNALDHGVESPAVRAAQGKPETGRLAIEARRLGAMMRIRVGDDGAGIDLGRLEGAVVAAGHTTHALWAQMGIEERMQFLFLPGLSTTRSVSITSGRGFGLDIVKAGIEASGGTVGVHSEEARGTCFELRVPLSLSLTRCLLVVGGQHPLFGNQRYAFPMAEVTQVRRLCTDELREIQGRLAVHLDAETLPLFQLHGILGLRPLYQDMARKHLLVLGEAEGRYALLVEEVVDELDMVARPLDERLGKVAQLSGLTLLDDGGVALIVDVPDLIQHMHDGAGHLIQTSSGMASAITHGEHVTPEEHPPKATQVLVVEDSVTVREVERHFLEQAGYQVTTAVNGMDGLNKAKAGDHRILITDIDMPRMNGIELIRTLRGIDRFRQLPIVVVSYKDRPEDRDKALEAGADRYVTKSEFDTDTMLALVAELLSVAARGMR